MESSSSSVAEEAAVNAVNEEEEEEGFGFLRSSWVDMLFIGMLSLAYGCLLGTYAALFVAMEHDVQEPPRSTSILKLVSVRDVGITLEVFTALDMLCLGGLLVTLVRRGGRRRGESHLEAARVKLERVVRMQLQQLHRPRQQSPTSPSSVSPSSNQLPHTPFFSCDTIQETEEVEEHREEEDDEYSQVLLVLPQKQTLVRSPIGTVLDAEVWGQLSANSVVRPSGVMME